MEAPAPDRADPEEPAGPGARDAPDATRIAAIVAGGRATRRSPSRGVWIAAAIVGGICAIAFVRLLALEGEPAERARTAEPSRARARAGDATGCLGGLGLGLGLGVAIGFGLARRQPRDHSSRSRP